MYVIKVEYVLAGQRQVRWIMHSLAGDLYFTDRRELATRYRTSLDAQVDCCYLPPDEEATHVIEKV